MDKADDVADAAVAYGVAFVAAAFPLSVIGPGVAVEGTLRQRGTEVERSSATLDYVPGESSRQGGLYFTADPRGRGLGPRVRGPLRGVEDLRGASA